jgi:hypothetical protein
MKKIEIIPIAKGKLERRKITNDWIIEAINYPGQIVEGYGGRKVAQRKYKIDGKEYLLRVIYEENEQEVIVLTAYLTSQIKRYWKEMRDEN